MILLNVLLDRPGPVQDELATQSYDGMIIVEYCSVKWALIDSVLGPTLMFMIYSD